MISLSLTPDQRQRLLRWMPALLAGGVAWIVFMVIGHTPILRASGMALAVVGMALALRPMGSALSMIGGLALALSPSFWIQTGGAESFNPLDVLAALIIVALIAGALLFLSKRPLIAAGAGFILFALIFLIGIGTPRSLRLTTLLTAWTLFLLIDGLFASNPRPDEPSNGEFGMFHTFGLLLLLAVGVVNDPLFVLLLPPVALGLFLSRKKLPIWYWLALLIVAFFGVYRVSQTYYSPFFWNYPLDEAIHATFTAPYMIASVWREPARWIRLMALIIGQFTAAGLALGVLGLARLSRWHPPVGVITMIAFGMYAAFGLVYYGADSSVLLLPLLMIQLLWMTYAMYTFGQWLQKSVKPAQVIAAAAFTLLPLFMLLRIVGMM